jgi:hypothetical protein
MAGNKQYTSTISPPGGNPLLSAPAVDVSSAGASGRYTSTLSLFANSSPGIAQPEKVVRPFEAFRERKDQALERLRAVPGESFEAELCWGEAPSNFPGTSDDPSSGFSTSQPDDEDEPAEPGPAGDLAWTEEWEKNKRNTEKIRVENPDDAEQYVMVERLKVLYMRAPSQAPFNGRRHKFTFKYK